MITYNISYLYYKIDGILDKECESSIKANVSEAITSSPMFRTIYDMKFVVLDEIKYY